VQGGAGVRVELGDGGEGEGGTLQVALSPLLPPRPPAGDLQQDRADFDDLLRLG